MPIYAYKCAACGFAKDVLQKISDAPLTQCPSCSQETFSKQVTAAGFQLKGSGWYVTDFREGNKGKDKPASSTEAAPAGGTGGSDTAAAKPEAAKSDAPKSDTAAVKKADAPSSSASASSTSAASGSAG